MASWVLVPGNAFTLTAAVTACIFLSQFYWLWWRSLGRVVGNRTAGIVALVLTLALAGLGVKAATVDFGQPAPEFFRKSQ